jgi:hypothetical protein
MNPNLSSPHRPLTASGYTLHRHFPPVEFVMRGLTLWCAAVAVIGLVAIGITVADDKAEKLSPDKLPRAVADAVKTRFPDGKITSAEKEAEGGKVVYDIELTSGGIKYEMDMLGDGTIVEIEKEIKEVPAAVAKAIAGKYPKAKIVEVMERSKVKDKKETPTDYEVTIEDGGKKHEVVVSLDGKSVKTEAEEKSEKK